MVRRFARWSWLGVAWWPLAWAAGAPHPWYLAVAPWGFALMEALPGTLWRGLYLVVAGWALGMLEWATTPFSWQALGAPIHALASPLGWLPWGGLLLGMAMRRVRTRLGVGFWTLAGVTGLAIGQVFWHVPATGPLALYLFGGLAGLAEVEWQRQTTWGARPPRFYRPLLVAVAAVPVGVGFLVPGRPSSDPGGLFSQWYPQLGPFATAQMGIPTGTAYINQSLQVSDQPVLAVHSPLPEDWQVAIYHDFNGVAWLGPSSSGGSVGVSPNASVPPALVSPYFGFQEELHVSVTSLTGHPLTALIYAGAPTDFSVPATYQPGTGRFTSTGVTHYSVSVRIPSLNAGVRQAGPAGFVGFGFPRFRRFGVADSQEAQDLAVPSNLSPRVAALARQIAAPATGAWAKVTAIKAYLLSHYRYSYTFTPTSQNVVNDFLFVSKAGYCDQFSTAFIMMVRSLGIPARWVVGYGPGTYQASTGDYLIGTQDIHSWAQVFLPGSGWVAVDPTPPAPSATGAATGPTTSTPSPAPTASTTTAPTPAAVPPAPPAAPPPGSGEPVGWVAGGLAALFTGLGLWFWRRLKSRPAFLWAAVQAWGWWFGRKRGGTPRELLEGLALPPVVQETAAALSRDLETILYSPHSLDGAALEAAWQRFHEVHRAMWKTGAWRRRPSLG